MESGDRKLIIFNYQMVHQSRSLSPSGRIARNFGEFSEIEPQAEPRTGKRGVFYIDIYSRDRRRGTGIQGEMVNTEH